MMPALLTRMSTEPHGFGGHPLAVGQPRHVGENRRGLDATRLYLVDRACQFAMRGEVVGQRRVLGTAEIDQRHVSAGLREFERDTAPYPASRSGHDRVFALEFHRACLQPAI
jgi:hypothetical protein